MARYIDADKLKAYLLLDQSGIKDTVRRNNHLHPDRKLELMAYIDAIEYCVMRINEELTADVVEVVRCKDSNAYNPINHEERVGGCEKNRNNYAVRTLLRLLRKKKH